MVHHPCHACWLGGYAADDHEAVKYQVAMEDLGMDVSSTGQLVDAEEPSDVEVYHRDGHAVDLPRVAVHLDRHGREEREGSGGGRQKDLH